jgi:hypothetical protein
MPGRGFQGRVAMVSSKRMPHRNHFGHDAWRFVELRVVHEAERRVSCLEVLRAWTKRLKPRRRWHTQSVGQLPGSGRQYVKKVSGIHSSGN